MIVSERKNDNKEILRDLFQNDEYISWVTNETNNGYVTDILNEIHYSNKEEQRKTNLLKYFYEGTKSYAYHNYDRYISLYNIHLNYLRMD